MPKSDPWVLVVSHVCEILEFCTRAVIVCMSAVSLASAAEAQAGGDHPFKYINVFYHGVLG